MLAVLSLASGAKLLASRLLAHAAVIVRVSSILRHADFYAVPRNLPFAAKFAACCGKMRNCPFLLLFYLIQDFLDSFLILPFIKQ